MCLSVSPPLVPSPSPFSPSLTHYPAPAPPPTSSYPAPPVSLRRCLPTYDQIGVGATFLLAALRIVQGK